MLLEFRASNYKSFKDEFVFSMTPAPKQKGLDYSILKEEINGKVYKGLSSAIIYGPNASGKTNIISAMDSFSSIVLRGHLRNEKKSDANVAASKLELIPNMNLEEPEPVQFSIKFTEENLLIEYSLSLDLGRFYDDDYKRRVLKEELSINNKMVFHRSDKLKIAKTTHFKGYWIPAFEKNSQSAYELAKGSLNQEELFLMNGFKNMFSSKIVSIIQNWLQKKFIVVYRADQVEISGRAVKSMNLSEFFNGVIGESSKIFGVDANTLSFLEDKEKNDTVLCSIIEDDSLNRKIQLPAEHFESYGTLRFVNLYPIIMLGLISGSTLIIDEFDASIHPMAIMSIINIFHNDEINKNGAQLIFNTHNPIFMNSNILRRDEIKFVERDELTHNSEHYSLSDFKTTGDHGVRNNEDYLKNYFINKYGAIKDIDFSDCIENMVAWLEKINEEEK